MPSDCEIYVRSRDEYYQLLGDQVPPPNHDRNRQ